MDGALQYVLLGGAPGVGKSTVARLLAAMLPAASTLEVDMVRCMVNAPRWKDRDEHLAMLGACAGLAVQLSTLGYCPVVVVDTFSGGKAVYFEEVLRARQPAATMCSIMLHAEEAVLAARVAGRPAGFFHDLAVSARINAEMRASLGPAIGLDITCMAAEDAAATILRLIQRA